MLVFKDVRFISSAQELSGCPNLKNKSGKPLIEIALVGRSNVGKSSLLNHLLREKNLARVSSTPGKTRLLNFFAIDNEVMLVDLPGYGYAKVPKTMREKWSQSIQDFLENRTQLQGILQLIDLRHPPTNDDLAFAAWAAQKNIPLIVVFTKSDKLKSSEKLQRSEENRLLLLQNTGLKSLTHVEYSIKESRGRHALIKEIEKLWG